MLLFKFLWPCVCVMTQDLINIRNILFQQVKNCPLRWHSLSCLWCPWLIYRWSLNPQVNFGGNRKTTKETPQNQISWNSSSMTLNGGHSSHTKGTIVPIARTHRFILFVWISNEHVRLCRNWKCSLSNEPRNLLLLLSIPHIN